MNYKSTTINSSGAISQRSYVVHVCVCGEAKLFIKDFLSTTKRVPHCKHICGRHVIFEKWYFIYLMDNFIVERSLMDNFFHPNTRE